jgi:c-di-GMP-binding flagellar brake protein YcgR
MYNKERRKYKRIEKSYTARLQIKQYQGQEMSSPDWYKVAVKNLSAGGMLFNYNKNLGMDSLLDLKIDFFESVPIINCIGRVVHIEESQPISKFRIATEFTEINEQEKELINKTIEEFLKYKIKLL